MKDTIKLTASVRMIAHRGLSGLERENTSAAFVAAGNRSYYGIETDVHRTADGQFIIIHDDSTLRMTGVDCMVEETALSDLREMHMTDLDGNARADLLFPTLAEYIGICRKYEKEAVLELKNHMHPEDIDRIITIIRDFGWLNHVIFISFDWANCLCIRERLPMQRVQFLTSQVDEALLDRLAANRLDLDAWYGALTPEYVAACHVRGIAVNVWTVDAPEDGQRMAAMGVDFITSNILE